MVQYLGFQVMTFTPALAGHPETMTLAGKAVIERQVEEIVTAIGERGDRVHRQLGFFVGPLTFDMKDEELRDMIDDAFAVAEAKDVAVGFHIDDSMFWNDREDLWSDGDNVEWSDWEGTTVPHRIIGWNDASGASFAKATAGPAAIRAYRKFLRGEALAEPSPGSAEPISGDDLHDRVERIQREVPTWVRDHPDLRLKLVPLIQELDGRLRANDPGAASRTADAILELIGAR